MGEIASAKDAVKEHNPPVVHESATVAGSTTAKSGAVPETSPTAGAGARAAWMRQLQRSVGNARAGAMAAVAAGGADTQPLAHELTHVVIQQRHDPVESADHGGALKVSDPSDRGEQAADVPTSRRSTVHDVLRGSGQPLDGPVREEMEGRLGADFSGVRLHTDAAAQRSATEIGARAYTSANHVVIGPDGADGHTMAHELTHVMQQRQGAVEGTDTGGGLRISDPSDRFEQAAEANARRVMSRPVPGSQADHGGLDQQEDARFGNRATVSLRTGPARVSGRSSPGFAPGPPVPIQRKLGLEVELNSPKVELSGRVPADESKPDWEKRDVIYNGDTWTLTLDDTPGGIREDEPETGRFNLEFILGGASGHGFDDDELGGLKAAIEQVGNWFRDNQGSREYNQTAGREPRNGILTVKIPGNPPYSANVQLTAGLALTGLYAMLAEAHESLTAEYGEIGSMETAAGGHLGALVEGRRPQQTLLKQFVPVSKVVDVLGKQSPPIEGSKKDDPAPRALAGMLTIIKTFASNAESQAANIKQATPILWKTPLNKFFDDPALKNYPVGKVWRPLAEAILGNDLLDKELTYPPPPTAAGKKFKIREWVLGLTLEDGSTGEDLLHKLDENYDKSFGGIGRLEGGTGPSAGHPIFEFRSFPNTWSSLTQAVDKAAEAVTSRNKPPRP